MLPERQGTSVMSLKCLLKIGAHPRGGFQGPRKPLKPQAVCVFCRGGWLQLALQNSPLGTGLLASDRQVLGVKRIIFILLLCQPHFGIWWWRHRCAAGSALPLFWMILQAPSSAQEQRSLGFLSLQHCSPPFLTLVVLH